MADYSLQAFNPQVGGLGWQSLLTPTVDDNADQTSPEQPSRLFKRLARRWPEIDSPVQVGLRW